MRSPEQPSWLRSPASAIGFSARRCRSWRSRLTPQRFRRPRPSSPDQGVAGQCCGKYLLLGLKTLEKSKVLDVRAMARGGSQGETANRQ